MPLLGYGADWRNFDAAVQRAKIAASNSSGDVSSLFGDVTQNSGGRPRADYRLARFAAYLVALNGDPRKVEIAAAQTYFAVKTREAEVAAPAVNPADVSRRDLALMVVAEADRADAEHAARQVEAAGRIAAEAKVAELEPQAAAANVLLDAHGTWSMGTLANMFGIGRTTLFRKLYEEKVLIERDRRPYQQYAKWFRVVATWHLNSADERVTDHTTYIYPEGALRLHAFLVKKGHTELNRPAMQGQLDLMDGGAA